MDNRAILTEDGERYLEVCYRLEDARKAGCRVETSLIFLDDTIAVFKAEVTNKVGQKVSEAYGSRASKFEPYYVEHAETAAIGRALSEAGYNIYSYELSEDLSDHAITLDDGADYLNVPYRVAKFRKEHPEAIIRKTILTQPLSKLVYGVATVKAEILYNDVTVATAHAQRRYEDDDKRRNFIECAETAAVGRALSILGYDLPPGEGNQFADLADIADSPLRNATSKKTDTPEIPADKEESPEPDTSEQLWKEMENASKKAEPTLKNTVVAIDAPMDPEEFVAPSGKHKGRTLGDLWKENWQYVRHLAYNGDVARVAEKELIRNAKLLCQKHGVMAEDEWPNKDTEEENDVNGKKIVDVTDLFSYKIPSGAKRGQLIGDVWKDNWQYVRKLAYDPAVEKVAEKELVQNARLICAEYGVNSIKDQPVSPNIPNQKPDTWEEAPSNTTYSKEEVERAGKTIIGKGMRHLKESIAEVYQRDRSYISWLAYKATPQQMPKQLIDAAKIYFEAHKN